MSACDGGGHVGDHAGNAVADQPVGVPGRFTVQGTTSSRTSGAAAIAAGPASRARTWVDLVVPRGGRSPHQRGGPVVELTQQAVRTPVRHGSSRRTAAAITGENEETVTSRVVPRSSMECRSLLIASAVRSVVRPSARADRRVQSDADRV